MKKLELYNNLYNITEYNNKIELCENSLKINIILSIGCYDIMDLINHIKVQFNEKSEKKGKNIKYEVVYNKNKNRINISADNQFNFRFVESQGIPLRFLLGFSNNEYMNNNNYTGDKDPILNIYDSIYIKLAEPEYVKCNIDYFNTFSNNVVCINEYSFEIQNKHICIEFFYRHNLYDKFCKITKQLSFNFEIEFV